MKNPTSPLSMDLWRLSIIGDLIHRHPEDTLTQAQRLDILAGKQWDRPDGTVVTFSAETLRKWLNKFQAGGLAALNDERSRPGVRIPAIIGEALIELRQQNPHWSVKLILEKLHKDGLWNTRVPSQATLYRWCKEHGLMRSRQNAPQEARAYEFTAFGALWSSDVLHGPKVFHAGRKRKAYLLAILDDASRFVTSAKFHVSEGVEPLIEDLRAALLRCGVPLRFYTDNGACYRSRILHQVGARLNIAMPHTPPYKPQGRGKIERFFRTVRERFLAATSSRTLDGLNRDLQDWISDYHRSPHSGIDQETPLDKRLRIENLCRTLPANTSLDPLFMQSRLVRLYKDGTFRLQNRRFEAPKAACAKRLEIFFLPWDLTTVLYGPERWPAKPLDKHANARRFENTSPKEPSHG